MFFVPTWATLLVPHTLQPDGAEDKALLGSNLSADSRAMTRLGPVSSQAEPQQSKIINWDWHQQRKIPGVWGQESPGSNSPFAFEGLQCFGTLSSAAGFFATSRSVQASLKISLCADQWPVAASSLAWPNRSVSDVLNGAATGGSGRLRQATCSTCHNATGVHLSCTGLFATTLENWRQAPLSVPN
jgi:hypothetical protein